MPDKPCVPEFGQCRSCALAAQKGPANGPFPTSHTEVCCLYKFQRQGQPPLCLKEKLYDGLCQNCPSRLKFQQQLQDQVPPLPELPSRSSSDAEEVRAPDTGKKGGLKIVPRRRPGFKKLTIEIRPPKFKKKLWFGTYEPEHVDRAADAINYYMGSNLPYNLSDSPSIFAQHRIDIEYRELLPSCEQFLEFGEKPMRATAFFAREVKRVIQTVTGKRGQKGRRRSTSKNVVKKESTPEPVASCASGVTSLPCASDCASAMAWEETSNVAVAAAATSTYGAGSSEANSEPAPAVNLPSSCEVFTSPLESLELFSEFFNWDENWDENWNMEISVPDWNSCNPLDSSSLDVDVEPGMDPSHFFSGGPE